MSWSAAAIRWATEQADRPHATREHGAAVSEIAAVWADKAGGKLHAYMRDRDLCQLAERRAELLQREVFDLAAPMSVLQSVDWLNGRIEALQGRPFTWAGKADGVAPSPDRLGGMFARAQCPLWWRRQLRRAVVRMREGEGIARNEVCKRRRQPYCTNDTFERRLAGEARNAAILEATVLENEDGEEYTLAALVEKSPAAKHIRRGELMTRIRGCEEWADAAGLVGVFTTNTAPSRFHSTTYSGDANPKHDGTFGPVQPNSPRDAQQWLCRTWGKARNKLQRLGVRFFGFRVAEPHHDGCPHWHMLLWTDPQHADALRTTLRSVWLADHGDEAGADMHRFKAVNMLRGQAAGYVAKYIAKNIDDAGSVGAEGHIDDEQGELFGATAKRVEAWAAAWGIRQFQAFGQPPVTVWRELRRVDAQAVEGASDTIKAAHAAVHRDGERRADWRAYMAAQGGPCIGRHYRVRMAEREELHEGRYETAEAWRPVGVLDAMRPDEWVLSQRRQWRAKGTWGEGVRQPARDAAKALQVAVYGEAREAAPVFPRTRFTNCPQRTQMAELWKVTRRDFESLNGGVHHRKAPHDPPGSPHERS